MRATSLGVALAPAVLAIIVFIPWVTAEDKKPHVLAIALGLAALSAWFTIGAIKDKERWVLHRDGLAYHRGKKSKHWTWDRIHATRSTAGNLPRDRYIRLWLDGKSQHLKAVYVDGFDELDDAIEGHIARSQLAAYLQRIDASVAVKLGRYAYDRDGIAQGTKRIAWGDVDLGPLRREGFDVQAKDAGTLKKLFGGFSVGDRVDPSPSLQHAICEAMIERAQRPSPRS